MAKGRISPLALGMAMGVTWGVSVLLMGLIACYLMYGMAFVSAMGTVYTGYDASIAGSLMGGVIGFVDAFVVGSYTPNNPTYNTAHKNRMIECRKVLY